jgi:hypothetical protein
MDAMADITIQVEYDKQIRTEHALEATRMGTNTPLEVLKALSRGQSKEQDEPFF